LKLIKNRKSQILLKEVQENMETRNLIWRGRKVNEWKGLPTFNLDEADRIEIVILRS